jgi:hypothetical protein
MKFACAREAGDKVAMLESAYTMLSVVEVASRCNEGFVDHMALARLHSILFILLAEENREYEAAYHRVHARYWHTRMGIAQGFDRAYVGRAVRDFDEDAMRRYAEPWIVDGYRANSCDYLRKRVHESGQGKEKSRGGK